MRTQPAPSQYDLNRAFNRARLGGLGYTLDTALATPALQIALTRLAQCIANPKRPSHLKGALND